MNMSVHGKKLAAGLFCVDWRLHQDKVRITEALRDYLKADVVDVMSVPGPDGLLKSGREGERDAVLAWFNLLIGAHHPQSVAIVGHYDCAGNIADDAAHDKDVEETLKYYKKATGFRGEMVALNAVRQDDEHWTLKGVLRIHA